MSRSQFPSGRRARPEVAHLIDLMAGFAAVQARAMFGGHGFFRDGLMFALLAGGTLYLKSDDQGCADFTDRNLPRFFFESRGRRVGLAYWQAPAEALENAEDMTSWCERGWQAALRAQSRGRQTRRTPSKARARAATATAPSVNPASESALTDLPNLGPASVSALSSAGIVSIEGLRQLGAVRAYVLAKRCSPRVSLNLLWALEGALSNRPWQEVAQVDRASLLMALEDAEREAGLRR